MIDSFIYGVLAASEILMILSGVAFVMFLFLLCVGGLYWLVNKICESLK